MLNEIFKLFLLLCLLLFFFFFGSEIILKLFLLSRVLVPRKGSLKICHGVLWDEEKSLWYSERVE